MRKQILASLTAFVLILSFIPQAHAADELTGLTLEKEMRAMLAQGIIKGYTDGTVRPKDDVTRDQFAAFIARALDLPQTTPNFVDVNTSSALAGSIGAVQQAGIMKGTLDLQFKPTQKITREEMVLTIGRVIKMKKLVIQNPVQIIIADVKDFFSDEGQKSAQTIASAKIMNGYAVNKELSTYNFKPKEVSKRDQVSAVIYRYLDLVAAQEPGDGTPPEGSTLFQVASIKDGALVKTTATYETYEEALVAFNVSTISALYKGSDIIKVKSGLAFAANDTLNVVDTASIYTSTSLTTQLTYTTEGREMKYMGSGPDYIIVQIGGSTGYAKHKEVDLIPAELVTGQDHYVKNGSSMLNHYVYNHVTKKSDFYTAGPAPSFMTPFVDYYSYDGVQFFNKQWELQGTSYSYFQFQSVRQPSNYTSEELESYIVNVLAEKQASGVAQYSGATTKSKLIGIGAYLKEMETTYRVNAMFILAAAIHESNFGISGNAMTKNNLFGIKVFDGSPEDGEKYAKPQDSILAFVTRYINASYGPQGGSYAKGMAPGNKTTGFNVHYASDPQWGSKIAGHMYRIDSFLGSKDYMQANLAVTNQTGVVNARYTPVVSASTLAFTYKAKDIGVNKILGYPLVILEEQNGADGYVWYKVLSDQVTPVDPVWVRSDIVNKITY
jgi:beta-N-acetylglucosaminidase